jgi:hypothetical protein
MKSLVAAIHRQHADVVYVLNSAQAFSNPADIAGFAGTSSKVIILNEVSGCLRANRSYSPMVQRTGNTVHLVSLLPVCAKYEFSGVPPPLLSRAFDQKLGRGSFATYLFPRGRITGHRLTNPNDITEIDAGKELDLEMTPEAGKSFVILYPDWNGGNYQCIGERCQ